MPTGEPAGSTLNVMHMLAAIKGKGAVVSGGSSQPVLSEQLPFEQIIRGAAVTGRIDHMLLNALNFGL